MSASVHVSCVTETTFGQNAYVVWSHEDGPCWLVDPGLPPSAQRLLSFAERRRLRPEAVVLTHAHADHIAGVPQVLVAHPSLPVYLADEEAHFLSDPNENLSMALGLPITVDAPDRRGLPLGGELALGGTAWRILDVSGHSPGGRALYCASAGVVIVGDALFQGSIGRTDFPHSDADRLIRNIRANLLTLPEETVVFSGHGERTTVGSERRTNPFVGDFAVA